MNVVLRGLQEAGLLDPPATVETGRARPTSLTDEGLRRLNAAQGDVYSIEARMIEAIPDERLAGLLEDLDRIGHALS